MKKALLVTLIACGVILLAGIAAIVVGVALGGTPSFAYDYKEKKIFTENTQQIYSDDLKVDAFDKIDLVADAATVTIKEGDGYEVSYKLYRKPIIKVEADGTLSIKPEKEKYKINLFQLGTVTQDPYIEITVPEGTALKNNVLDVDAGGVKIDGINMDKLNLDVDAGNVKISNMNMESVFADIDAGNLDLSSCELDSFEVDVDAGNVDVDDAKINTIKADIDFGNMDISLHGEEADYGMELDCDAGKIKLNDKKVGNNYSCEGNAGKKIEINADAGNVDIEIK